MTVDHWPIPDWRHLGVNHSKADVNFGNIEAAIYSSVAGYLKTQPADGRLAMNRP
ncbi:hypothetical protein [Sphingopyxis sp. UBA6723]|uniref:hypothetical protein n=1 Tax=Sphingopyxis sp. UBA6723 TaxID=1947538 RepID=UPI0025E97B5F|nr:hypothetical protein [Sphingopyxis sp. UBA6723]